MTPPRGRGRLAGWRYGWSRDGRATEASHTLRLPATDDNRVQDGCMHLGHVICEMVGVALFLRP